MTVHRRLPRTSASSGRSRDRRLGRRHAGAAVGARPPGRARRRVLVICASARLIGAEHRLLRRRARSRSWSDPNFHGGDYYDARRAARQRPRARAHGRTHHLPLRGVDASELRPPPPARRTQPLRGFGIDFAVESYLEYQGESFAQPLRRQQLPLPTRACMDYFDPFADETRRCRRLRGRARASWSLVRHRLALRHRALARDRARARAAASRSRSARSRSPHGHDSFLLDVPEYHRRVQEFVRDVEVRA